MGIADMVNKDSEMLFKSHREKAVNSPVSDPTFADSFIAL